MRRTSPLLLMLLLVGTLMLRAGLPAGWMPAPLEDGVRVLICTGHGPAAIDAPEALRDALRSAAPDSESDPGEPRDPCPFGLAFGSALDLPSAPPLAPALAPAPQRIGPAPIAARLAALRSLRPPARGPPSFA